MAGPAGALAAHLPALQVVLPLLAAPLCTLLYRPRLSWWLAMATSVAALGVAAALLASVLASGPVSYALGGWAAPWGIEYRVDEVNAFVLLIVSAMSTLVLPFARVSVAAEVSEDRVSLFYTAWLLCLTGLLGIAITGDAFNVFVFLEISSLSTYILISLGTHRRALPAAFRYLVMGTVGATFFLIGVGLLYALTGTLNMQDLAARLPEVSETRTVRAAFGFIAVGVGLKAGLFPLHAWLPNAYTQAPSAVTAFIAGTSTKVAIYVLLRFTFTVFGVDMSFGAMGLEVLLLPLALAAMLVASGVAVFQANAKRLLAYSSVAQVGYIVLGVALVSHAGLTGGVVHLFNHAIAKAALFMALGCVVLRTGSVGVAAMAGLGRRMPFTMAGFVIAALSLVGVPVTAGFISKWYLLLAALERGWWPIAVVIVVASLLAVVYTGRVVEAAYFREADSGSVQARAREAPAAMLVPLWVLVLANLYFGVHTDLTVGVAGRAAGALLGGSS